MKLQLNMAILFFSCSATLQAQKTAVTLNTTGKDIQSVLAKQILQKANQSLQEKPITVTTFLLKDLLEINTIFFQKEIIGGPILAILKAHIFKKMVKPIPIILYNTD